MCGLDICVEFKRFHTKHLTSTMKYVDLIRMWKFISSQMQELVSFWNALPLPTKPQPNPTPKVGVG